MKTTRFLSLLVTAAAVTALVACGGSDNSEEEVVEPIPAGVWLADESTYYGQLVVLDDGETWGYYEDAGTSSASVFYGQTTGQGGGSFTGTLHGVDVFNDTHSAGSYAGTYVDQSEINATAQIGSSTFELDATDDGLFWDYDTPGAVAGLYMGEGISNESYFETVAVGINDSGDIAIQTHWGCDASGVIVRHQSGKNVFNLSMAFDGADCVLGDGTAMKGVVLGNGDYLTIIALDESRTKGFYLEEAGLLMK